MDRHKKRLVFRTSIGNSEVCAEVHALQSGGDGAPERRRWPAQLPIGPIITASFSEMADYFCNNLAVRNSDKLTNTQTKSNDYITCFNKVGGGNEEKVDQRIKVNKSRYKSRLFCQVKVVLNERYTVLLITPLYSVSARL